MCYFKGEKKQPGSTRVKILTNKVKMREPIQGKESYGHIGIVKKIFPK